MTIPDLGHCAGSGAQPLDGTVRREGDVETAVCGACSGRFELGPSGMISLHATAPVEERESSAEAT